MDELVERVREALVAEYPGAPNGRVRDVPDRRAIRWYTTIGLVDKPLGMRGRTALYGPRHLQQLVGIKRRQAEGHSLARIQIEFAQLSQAGLDEVSRIPLSMFPDTGATTGEPVRRDRFWAHGTGPFVATSSGDPEPVFAHDDDPPMFHRDHSRTRPHATPAASGTAARAARPDAAGHRSAPHPSAVALGSGVYLIIPQPLTDTDRDDIAVAADPLLALLADRGLTDGSSA
jgi:hypothetical protein